MALLALALPLTLRHEGGWSDDPDDPGGATMRGITLETARQHGIASKGELRQISDEKIEEIYRASFWNKIQGDAIDDQRVAAKFFDMAVNFGPITAGKLMQQALNELGAGLEVDGNIGPKTVASINAVSAEVMLPALCEAAKRRYLGIVERRPTSEKFLKGWLRRAEWVPNV